LNKALERAELLLP
jgi:hypothetical protein